MVRSILSAIALAALALLPTALAAPPAAVGTTAGTDTSLDTKGTHAPESWCCRPGCTGCLNISCRDDHNGCFNIIIWTTCCAAELNKETGVYTNVNGEVITMFDKAYAGNLKYVL
ncbi:hypothetical protein QBC34DRAFT_467738 [Podospora aff. communis PSN243]|uniref:Uncharacterized protein n=1 Tax=Podospora aff. communis PSN243 TaxID=3040156 RepID=A0AAV9GG65_9PEZI|nr:hypothetical protein QBC34DRAFT_467738 [Podospora aff. communis PSN243]